MENKQFKYSFSLGDNSGRCGQTVVILEGSSVFHEGLHVNVRRVTNDLTDFYHATGKTKIAVS